MMCAPSTRACWIASAPSPASSPPRSPPACCSRSSRTPGSSASKASRSPRRTSASNTRARASRPASSRPSAPPSFEGRAFTEQDHAQAPLAVIVNETLANSVWAGEDPIGRRLRPGDGSNPQVPWFTVVGVVKDLRRADVKRNIRPEVYLSALQNTPRTGTIVFRAAGDPAALMTTIRRELQSLDPQLAALPRHDAGRRAVEHAEPAALPGDAARRIRVDRAAARVDRHLRRHVARGQPADAGGRHPHGDGRAHAPPSVP